MKRKEVRKRPTRIKGERGRTRTRIRMRKNQSVDDHTALLLKSRVGKMEWSFGHHVCQGLHGKARASISISICCTRSVPSFFCRVGLAWTKANWASSRLGKISLLMEKGYELSVGRTFTRAAVYEIS